MGLQASLGRFRRSASESPSSAGRTNVFVLKVSTCATTVGTSILILLSPCHTSCSPPDGVLAVRLRELFDPVRGALHIAAQLVPSPRQNLLRLLGMLRHCSSRARHPRTNRHMLPQPRAAAERFELEAPLGA